MSRNARIGIIIAILGLGLIAVGIVVLNRMVTQILTPAPAPTIKTATTQVVIVTHDVSLGDLLQPEDVSLLEIPIGVAPRNALSEVSQAIGRIVKGPLVSGQMVLEHQLADPTNVNHDLAFVIGENQVLMAVPAGDLMSSLNILQPGDVVDIFVSLTQMVPSTPAASSGQTNSTNTGTGGQEEVLVARLFTFDALQTAKISAVVADVVVESQRSVQSSVASSSGEVFSTPTPQPSEVKVKAYILALSPQDALLLKHLKDSDAVFDYVLRAPTSNQYFNLTPITSEYLIEKYQLEIKPAP